MFHGGGQCPALCVAGLARRAAWPWPPARCHALFQRQLPVGMAWQPSLLQAGLGQDPAPLGHQVTSVQGCNTRGHRCHDFAVLSSSVAFPPGFLCQKAEEGMSKEPVLRQSAEKSLWRGASGVTPCRSDVSALKAPGFPPWSCVRLPVHTGALGVVTFPGPCLVPCIPPLPARLPANGAAYSYGFLSA